MKLEISSFLFATLFRPSVSAYESKDTALKHLSLRGRRLGIDSSQMEANGVGGVGFDNARSSLVIRMPRGVAPGQFPNEFVGQAVSVHGNASLLGEYAGTVDGVCLRTALATENDPGRVFCTRTYDVVDLGTVAVEGPATPGQGSDEIIVTASTIPGVDVGSHVSFHPDETGADVIFQVNNTRKVCKGGLGDISNLVGLWEGTGSLQGLSGPYNVTHDDIGSRTTDSFNILVAIDATSNVRQFTATRCARPNVPEDLPAPMVGGLAPDLSRGKAKIYFRDSTDPLTYPFGTWEFDFFCEDEGQVIFDHDLNTNLGGSSATIGTMEFKKIGDEVICPARTDELAVLAMAATPPEEEEGSAGAAQQVSFVSLAIAVAAFLLF